MRVIVVGAGQVGHTVVKSLAETHECTVIDIDEARLQALSHTYDVRITRGSGTRRETLLEAGVADAELVLACTSRDEVNLVIAMLARRLSSARTVVRADRAGGRGHAARLVRARVPIVRHLILFRFTRHELEQAVHPDAVLPVRVSGRVVDNRALRSALVFALLYVLALALGTLCLAVDARGSAPGNGAFTALGAAAACLGNVGPAFGELGPVGSYAPLGTPSKAVLTALMLLGRIEIGPLAVLLRRGYWRA
ncbi:NAD-binding protein [Streptomyces pilosus]